MTISRPGPARARARSLVLGLALLLVLVQGGAAAADGARAALTQRVQLRGGTAEIEVRFDADQRAWGAYHLRQAAAYLPAVEAYLGVSLHQALVGFLGPKQRPPSPFRIIIDGQRQVLLNGKWIGAYNNSGGLFPGERAIFVEYGLTMLGNPSLIFHELGHFWIYDSAGVTQAADPGGGSASWFNEGAVSVMPLAVHEAGLLPLTQWEAAAVGDHWGLRHVPFQVDAPVEEDLRPRGGPLLLLFYQKSFLSQVLLRRWLGPADYRGLLQRAARAPGELYRADGVLALMTAQRPLAWKKLLGGWVYRGPYGPIGPLAFRGAAVRPDGGITIPERAGAAEAPAPSPALH